MAEKSVDALASAGEFTRRLVASYADHFHPQRESTDGGGEAHPLSTALKSLDLPISGNQVQQLLSVSKELQVRGQSTVGEGLSWGEFCVCCVEVLELKKKYPVNGDESGADRGVTNHPPKTAPAVMNCHASRQSAEVFLGGSCNPTTWRRDHAIPALQAEGVTYYNPQVDEWYPELIEVEERAKDAASLLFFVIDSQTRAVSSMVEMAFFAGMGRDLVVVVDDILKDSPRIGDDQLSSREVEDLNRGRAFVRSLLETGGSLLALSVQDGVKASSEILKGGMSVSQYSSSTRCLSVPRNHGLGERLALLKQVFLMYDTNRKGSLSLQEAVLAFRSVHIDTHAMYNQLGCKKVDQTIRSNELLSRYEEQGLTFDDFCMVYAELRYAQVSEEAGNGSLLVGLAYLTAPIQWISGWLWPTPPTHPTQTSHYDVFLGGSCGHTTWRTEIAVPTFRQTGVSYFNPQVQHWDVRMIPIEREAKEHSDVLLFVVCGDTLSVASMVEVAYYIGAGRKMVLCLVDISCDGGTEIEGMKLSARAIKDYNRGRAYLASVANKNRVPIFTNIPDAVHRAMHLVRGHYLPRSPSGTSV
ncbi:uncharacterized protein LOC135343031 [Halichondria panicea]|uniref:uncharacterized protein LOC135343031 n=1 Tax=Halichondria panicea TaxID=6063 RepID=UPI00312B46BE